MNSNFDYVGRVIIKTLYKGREVCSQHFNSGTDDLFRAYAMALSGQSISNYLPSYINIGYKNVDTFSSILRNEKGVSVVRTFVSEELDGKTRSCTRITLTLDSNMFNTTTSNDDLTVRLLGPNVPNSNNVVLAEVVLNDTDKDSFLTTINSTPSGTQLIIVWDLYVKESVK